MAFALSFLFVAMAVVSAFLQASQHPAKNTISPGLTAFCALLVFFGFWAGNVSSQLGIPLAIALLLLAMSDFTFERSIANESYFPLAILFGVVSGFIVGITFVWNALDQGTAPAIAFACFLMSTIAAVLVYRLLEVPPALRIAIVIYLLQAVVLLAGGLLSLLVGNYAFAIWGIFIFLSDSLVGIRAFPNKERPMRWLTPYRILLLIITIYYAAQYALVIWAV